MYEPSRPALFLSRLKIENFGSIVDETFEFSQGVNLISVVDLQLDQNARSKGKVAVAAIKILLACAGLRDRIGGSGFTFFFGHDKESPSKITGYFRERNTDSDTEGSQLALCFTRSRAGTTFQVNDSPEPFPEVCRIFSTHGLHRASVITLSTDMIFREKYVPMSFFWDESLFGETLDAVQRSTAYLESDTLLPVALELARATEMNSFRLQTKVQLLVNSHDENADLLEHLAQLPSLVKYTKLRKAHDALDEKRRQIEDMRARIELEDQTEQQRETEGLEQLMSKLVIDLNSDHERGASGVGKMTLERTLQRLKSEVEEKRTALNSLGSAVANREDMKAEERALKADLEDRKSQLLMLYKSLACMEADRDCVSARLQVIRNKGLGGDCMKHASHTLTRRISRLEELYMAANNQRFSSDEELSKCRARLEEISREKKEIEKKLEAREEQLLELFKEETMKNHARQQTEDELLSGRVYENLEADVVETLSPNHLNVIEAMTSILKEFGVQPKASAWRKFGFFGAVIDHINVEPEHRGLLRPIRELLCSFLVRDVQVAWKLREKIQKLEFEGCVKFFSFENYDRLPKGLKGPRGTKPLSTYLNTKDRHRYPLTTREIRKLGKIIACELMEYLVIEGEPSAALEKAREFSREARWASRTFVFRDGTCFGQNSERFPGATKDPLTTYELLWDYWTAKNEELRSRFDEMMQARTNHQKAEEETRALLEENRQKLAQIDSLRADIRFYETAKKRLDRETELISSRVENYTNQAITIQATEKSSVPHAFELELENISLAMDEEIAGLRDKILFLDDSISKSMKDMVEYYVRLVPQEVKDSKILCLQEEILRLEALIKEAEFFVEKYGELEMDGDDGAQIVNQVAKRRAWYSANAPLFRSRIFLLEKKLARIEDTLEKTYGRTAPQDWNPNTNYARQLRLVKQEVSRLNLLLFTNAVLSEMRAFCGMQPWDENRVEVSVDSVEQLKDYPREVSVRDLEQGILKSVLESFEMIVSESHPSSEVWISASNRRVARVQGRRNLRSGEPLRKDDLIEVVFDDDSTRNLQGLSDEQKCSLLISALIARSEFNIPRVLWIDENDVFPDSLPRSLHERFFDELGSECQMFILSRDASLRSHPVHRRIEFQETPNGRAEPSPASAGSGSVSEAPPEVPRSRSESF